MADVCECASNWRIELTDLLTGEIRHAIVPTKFEFETSFLEAGRGSISFNRKGTERLIRDQFVHFDDMEPYSTGIFFSRIHGGDATPQNPVHMFGGYIETLDSGSDGMVTLGFAEMQKYLDFRMIRSDLTFTGIDQTVIAANLVLYARGENLQGGSTDPSPSLGIPLIGGSATSAFSRNRTYLAVDRTVIGEALKNFLEIEDGPVYFMDHVRAVVPGLTLGWYSEMFFRDTWFQDSIPRISWNHVTDLRVFVDGNGLANQIDAFGKPLADGSANIATADSPFSFNPRFDAAPSFPTVSNAITLGQHAVGYQEAHRDPALNIQLEFSGLDYGQAAGGSTLSLDDLVPGNECDVDIRSPYWVIEGGPNMEGTHIPRIGRVSVAVDLEGPEKVTAQIIVDSFPGNMLSGPPAECEDC